MIVVKVELWSAVTGRTTELARAVIHNTGESTNPRRGDYGAFSLKGRCTATLHAAMVKALVSAGPVSRRGEVKNHARLQEHVWNLVAKALASMGYGE